MNEAFSCGAAARATLVSRAETRRGGEMELVGSVSRIRPSVSDARDREPSRRAVEAYGSRIDAARGVRRLYRQLELRAVERALAHADGESVLDCPCGTGRLDALLRSRFERVVGVDRSGVVLDVYRRGDPRRWGRRGDAFALPWRDGSFDWVVSHRFLHHVTSDERRLALLRSLARVARRGIIVYALVETPLRRGWLGAKTIPFALAHTLIRTAGLELQAAYFAAWPFHPKVELVARKADRRMSAA